MILTGTDPDSGEKKGYRNKNIILYLKNQTEAKRNASKQTKNKPKHIFIEVSLDDASFWFFEHIYRVRTIN